MKISSAVFLFIAFAPAAALASGDALASASALAPAAALTQAAPMATATPDGHPTAAEKAFVAQAMTALLAAYPTTASAMKAGYIRFTDEDDTGAISYANRKWTSTGASHPSQLWYDANGRLIGADYSVLQADSPKAPSLWGLDPSRWQTFDMHIHYGLVGPNGTTYGAIGPKSLTSLGLDPSHPTPASIVAAGKAKSTKDVRFVFAFPAIWDVGIWLIPNPKGAFADANPNLKPSMPAKMNM